VVSGGDCYYYYYYYCLSGIQSVLPAPPVDPVPIAKCPTCSASTLRIGIRITSGPYKLGKCGTRQYRGLQVPENGTASVFYCKKSHAGGPGCHLEKDKPASLELGKFVWWEGQS
jgi:hypothetical protein